MKIQDFFWLDEVEMGLLYEEYEGMVEIVLEREVNGRVGFNLYVWLLVFGVC